MYVYKNKESGLYLVLSVKEMHYLCDYMTWSVSETDEISFASKFDFAKALDVLEVDNIEGFNFNEWEIIRL